MKKRQNSNESSALESELERAAQAALGKILELAESESIDSKTKYDICKWLCEMHFGKPGSSGKSDSSASPIVLSFSGELEKWSE